MVLVYDFSWGWCVSDDSSSFPGNLLETPETHFPQQPIMTWRHCWISLAPRRKHILIHILLLKISEENTTHTLVGSHYRIETRPDDVSRMFSWNKIFIFHLLFRAIFSFIGSINTTPWAHVIAVGERRNRRSEIANVREIDSCCPAAGVLIDRFIIGR